MIPLPTTSALFPYTTLFRSRREAEHAAVNRFGKHHMIARAEKPEDGVDARHARRENVSAVAAFQLGNGAFQDRKSTRLNSSHRCISYAVFCLKKKKKQVPAL